MFLDDPLTEAEREELQTLNDEVTTAINKRKEWLDKKMAEKAHLKIGDEIYDCRKGTKLGVVSRHYRYWADRDEGVRDSSLDINYEYETSPNCFDNTSRQIGVSFGSREDARKYAEMQARRLA